MKRMRWSLRVRVTIAGEPAVDQAMTLKSAKALSDEHYDLVVRAQRSGQRWLVEVTDPGGNIVRTRFGNDPADMDEPIRSTMDGVAGVVYEDGAFHSR